MDVIIVKDYEEMSRVAADIVAEDVQKNPRLILGLATGSSPIGLYQELVRRHQNEGLDFSQTQSFNLDEYAGLSEDHPQSYHYFMNEHLFSKINIQPAHTHFPTEEDIAPDALHSYDAAIADAGGVDLQILGIGRNGHIAFNEPGETLSVNTSLVQLTPSTIEANARFFDRAEDVPQTAYSSGMGTIMKAKKLLILASGAEKADAVQKVLAGDTVSTDCPVTLTLLHPHVVLIVDEAAAGAAQ